ncbi:MAG: class I SAM-dependent methyltransferase [Caulobacteraceae bacterium]
MSSVNYFDSIAEKWNEIRTEYYAEELRDIALSRIDTKDKICSDLGCGTGFISLGLAEKAKLVFSIDNSTNMLKELSKTSASENKDNIYPIRGNMDNIPLFDCSIDVIFTNMALHHVADAKKAISEIFRILKPGGTAVIADVEEHSGYWAIEEMHDVWLGFSKNQLIEWFEEAGFDEIDITSTGLRCKGYSRKGEYTETGIFIAIGKKREAL